MRAADVQYSGVHWVQGGPEPVTLWVCDRAVTEPEPECHMLYCDEPDRIADQCIDLGLLEPEQAHIVGMRGLPGMVRHWDGALLEVVRFLVELDKAQANKQPVFWAYVDGELAKGRQGQWSYEEFKARYRGVWDSLEDYVREMVLDSTLPCVLHRFVDCPALWSGWCVDQQGMSALYMDDGRYAVFASAYNKKERRCDDA